MSDMAKAFAACIGEVNNRYLDHEPPVVGATFLAPTAEYDFGVQFLMPAEADVARAHEQELPQHLTRAIKEAMVRRNIPFDEGRLRVGLSSLEAEGIKR